MSETIVHLTSLNHKNHQETPELKVQQDKEHILDQNSTCGIMDILWRRVCSPISDVRKPSIVILPSGSASRNKAEIRELLPAPVRPTMPTYNRQNCFISQNFPLKKQISSLSFGLLITLAVMVSCPIDKYNGTSYWITIRFFRRIILK